MSCRILPALQMRMLIASLLMWFLGICTPSHSQTSLSFGEQRPFVVGVIPVAVGGAVGGVSIDATGAVQQAVHREVVALQTKRHGSLAGAAGDVTKSSKLRKISLRRLDSLLADHASRQKPLPTEVLSLAGLLQVEYVFAYPKFNDIVLAGPAEGWQVDQAGNLVGATSRDAVLQLVDLITALRTTDKLLAGELISCSIDPTPTGIKELARLTHFSRRSPSEGMLRRMVQVVGPQSVTLTGVTPTSHFAQVLVAADWQMKRLAMGLTPSPVSDLTSYLELLRDISGQKPQTMLPRWWIAYGKQPVECDPEGLGWRISRPGIEVCTAVGRLDKDGRIVTHQASDPLAEKWAGDMTALYDELSIVEPVFDQLHDCMNLSLVTAVVASGELLTQVGLELPMIFDDTRLQLAAYPVPKTVASQASAVRVGRSWVVGASGGVELDVPRVVNATEVREELRKVRKQAGPRNTDSWWWD